MTFHWDLDSEDAPSPFPTPLNSVFDDITPDNNDMIPEQLGILSMETDISQLIHMVGRRTTERMCCGEAHLDVCFFLCVCVCVLERVRRGLISARRLAPLSMGAVMRAFSALWNRVRKLARGGGNS